MPDDPDLFGPASPVPVPALVYAGSPINERGEMLSLTDMWTAARRKHVEDGGDAAELEARRPSDWRALPETKRFVEALSQTLNAGKSGIPLFETARGAGGGTLAHWQVGLAYAKYLSAEFHMWCNTVVRAHMEGMAGPAPTVIPTASRTASLTGRAVVADFKAFASLGPLLGYDTNQAALAANRAVRHFRGIDLLAALGATHLVAPQQEVLLRVTDLGHKIGGLTAKATNLLLTKHGFQVASRDADGDLQYEATGLGRPHSRMMDVDIDKPGTSKQQLRWLTSVVEPLQAAIGREEDAA